MCIQTQDYVSSEAPKLSSTKDLKHQSSQAPNLPTYIKIQTDFGVAHVPPAPPLTSFLLISLQQKHCEQVHSIRAICTTIIIADAKDLLQA